GTYASDQTLVYHFSDKSGPPTDQTAYKNDAQTAGGVTDGSLIGGGLKLDGTSPVVLPDSPSLALADGAPLTWSAWIKPDADAATGVVFARHDGDRAFVIGLDQGVPYVSVTSGGATLRSPPTDALEAASWHHLAVTAADQVTLYVDGQPRGTVAAHLPALADKATLGGDGTGGGPPFVGEIDELEIAKVARSPGFVAASVASQGPNGKLVVYGEDEQNAGWSGGYFGVILKSVTLDGWVVIGILMVMALISWMVMVNKAIVVGRVARGNGVFLRAFHGIGRDLTALDGEIDEHSPLLAGLDARARRSIPDSSLYRIYRLGAEELRLRFGVDTPEGYARILSPQSIAAIRAALDTGVVRETQRLNRLMVLLTIAISGGPFLGLLGTVVGVMITFAAIAAAGDVNVNAIAPGIAAALVATVAGLGVAIPALFGYNYLLTRIKDATADMHVFVDEFVTRLAEFYCTQPISREMAAE
ncbi:MAG: MotA/TolQ/ExbB proton channel family protein, partial [Alphaproteobacteria bacterium]|nr:MotA/TolQ/ExbB proton channel family protein [Alphaproteobacteria bacterium]